MSCSSMPSISKQVASCFSIDNYNATKKKWSSNTGGYAGTVVSGSVTVRTDAAGSHGNRAAVAYLAGGASTKYTFGNVLPNPYTLCSATRYTGKTRRRILNGGSGNWLHGHWGGRAGVAHYGGWSNGGSSRVSPVTDWVYMCDHNGDSSHKNLFVNGKSYSRNGNGRFHPSSIKINHGPHADRGETSDWGVAMLITFKGVLSDADMLAVYKFMTTGTPKIMHRARRFDSCASKDRLFVETVNASFVC